MARDGDGMLGIATAITVADWFSVVGIDVVITVVTIAVGITILDKLESNPPSREVFV